MRVPPYISNENRISRTDFEIFIDINLLTKTEVKFAKELFDKVCESKDDIIDINEAKTDSVKSPSGVRKKLETLATKGVLKKSTISGSASKPATIFYFEKPKSEIVPKSISIAEPSSMINAKVKNTPSVIDRLNLDLSDLITKILYSSFGFSSRKTETTRSSNLIIMGEKVSVRITCSDSEGSTIAKITDLRYYLAILSICEYQIQKRKVGSLPMENIFLIDISLINQVLDRENSGGNISTALKAFDRLSDTSISISNWPKKILEKYNLESGVQRINLLNDMAIASIKSGDKNKRRFVKFSLPFSIYSSISQESFKLGSYNTDWLNERNEVIFALHFYCRAFFSSQKTKHYPFKKLVQLHQAICPQMDYKEFKEKLFSGLIEIYNSHIENNEVPIDSIKEIESAKKEGRRARQIKLQYPIYDESGDEMIGYTADVYGFYFKLRGDEYSIRVNAADRHVGVPSSHFLNSNVMKNSISPSLLMDITSNPLDSSKEQGEMEV